VSAQREQMDAVIELLAGLNMPAEKAAVFAALTGMSFRSIEALERQAVALERQATAVELIARKALS
jgi:hypothetical protein